MYGLEVAGYFARDYSDGMSEEMKVSIQPTQGGRVKNQCAEKW